jgi:aspartate/methionine/tyrosine aminotransferase
MAIKASRRGQVSPFIVMDVMRAANQRAADGGDVLHLEIGQPSTPAPGPVLAAARAALGGDRIGYTDALGLNVLRARIAGHYADFYGITLDPARVVTTTGSSGGFLLAFLAAFDVGDRVAMANPSYPAYRNILSALGLEPVLLPAAAVDRYQPTVALLEAARLADGGDPPDGLIVASPANPTGCMIEDSAFAALAAYCREHGIRLVSDEVYHGITFDRPARSALDWSDDAIVINSFSKYFSMTGWRLGWMVAPPDLLRAVECLAQNLFISPPTLSQLAAMAAFDAEDELQANVARYARNRDILRQGLPRAGFDRLAPADGAFYIYAEIDHLTDDSAGFCRRLLADTGVAATPGLDFDPDRGATTLRLSFAGTEAEMVEAVSRLEAWSPSR